MEINIRSLLEDNVDDALFACTPDALKKNPFYEKGLEVRRRWLLNICRTVGPCAKIAYVNNIPVGMIQYTPLHYVPYFSTKRRDALYIHCIFTKRRHRLKGVATKLLGTLVQDMRKPRLYFEGKPCRLLVTSARKRYGSNQESYFRKKGFTPTEGNVDAGLVFWLSKPTFNESLDMPKSKPIKVKEEGIKIFYTPQCQYCMLMNKGVKKLVLEFKPEARIEEINLWTQPEEAIRRGIACLATYVNGEPILPLPPEQFEEKIRRLLVQQTESPLPLPAHK